MEHLEYIKNELDNFNKIHCFWQVNLYRRHRESILNNIDMMQNEIFDLTKKINLKKRLVVKPNKIKYNYSNKFIRIRDQYSKLLESYQLFFEQYFYDGAEKFYI